MPSTNKFDFEYAKSNMSTCRVCMAKIPKDSLRLGHSQVPLENDATAPAEPKEGEDARRAIIAGATKWYHFECIPKMKGAKWMAANLPSDPLTIPGFAAVKKEDQKRIYKLWKALQSEGGGSSSSAGGKRKADGKEDDGKKAKIAQLTSVQGVLKPADFKNVQKFEAELASLTSAQLQKELADNNQVRGGKKDELVQRVAEGRVLGALPPCPRCEKGQLHWSRIGGWYSCPGFYDKELSVQRRCYFRAKEMERLGWKGPGGKAKGKPSKGDKTKASTGPGKAKAKAKAGTKAKAKAGKK